MKATRTDLLRPGEPKSETERLWTRIKEALLYNPTTGKWIWLKNGQRAGTLNRTNSRYYIKFEQKQYAAYRLAWLYMTGNWPTEIDHIDRNSLNDRWLNLREVTHSDNIKNSCLKNDPVTGRFYNESY